MVDQVVRDLDFDSIWEAKQDRIALEKYRKQVKKEVEEELY
jgi:hypothetical protein